MRVRGLARIAVVAMALVAVPATASAAARLRPVVLPRDHGAHPAFQVE